MKKVDDVEYWSIWQEGQKPCQIISAQLNVGGYIKRDASNGNARILICFFGKSKYTGILINNREITKEEVWRLKVIL